MGILDNKRRGKDCSLIQENKWGASWGARAVKELLYSYTYYCVLLPYLSDVFFHCWKPMDWINLLSLRSISWHIWIWACNKAFLLHSNDDIGTPLQTSRFLMHSPRISKVLQLSSFRAGDGRFDKMTYHPGTNSYKENASFWENSKEASWSWGSWGLKDNVHDLCFCSRVLKLSVVIQIYNTALNCFTEAIQKIHFACA